MVLQKDPDGDITQLEEISYQEVFSDINTPAFWKAENEDDLKTSKAVILDGHSTILVYNQSNEDLLWTAYNELGQYKYTPDNIGDGIVIFSHNFYYEFKVSIGDQEVTVESTLDGDSIKAIALPFKDVPIDELFSTLTKRIEEAVTSEVQSFDDTISASKGKKIVIPESILMKIGMKLSLMGITLTGMKAKEVIELEGRKEENVVEQVFEEKSTKMKEMLEVEEKESKKRKRSKSKKKDTSGSDEILAPKAQARSTSGAAPATKASPPPAAKASPPPAASGGPGGPGGPPPAVSSASAPPPSVKTSGSPTPPPLAAPAKTAAASPPPPAAKPKRVIPALPAKPKPMPEPIAAMEEVEAEEEEDEAYLGDAMGFADSEMDEDVLIAKGMVVTDKPMSLRYTHTSYFSRMLLNRAYPLVVKISMEEVGVKKSITSVVSGERITEKEETLVVAEDDPNVTIKPEFPGCFVVPTEQVVDITEDNVEVKFHVTPLALGTLDGAVKFVQSGSTIHSMNLETKVITHRISKWLATAGGAASAIPFMIAFALDETVPQFMEKRLDRYMSSSISELGGWILGIITALFLFASGFVYRIQKPRRSSSSLAFPR